MKSVIARSSENMDRRQVMNQALDALEGMQRKLKEAEGYRNSPIAIVGLGLRFPGGAETPEAFWKLLKDGKDAVQRVPAGRWDIESYFDPNPDSPGKMYTCSGGFLNQVDQFDPQFFGISPREAVSLDPQQRLILEVSWEALERAGYSPAALSGSRTGVYVGIGSYDYFVLHNKRSNLTHIDAYTGSGSSVCFAAGRLSYCLGLQGPSLIVDTACSSSLVAVHLACQSLRIKESDVALAGGVNLMLAPDIFVYLSKIKALAPDGRCKTFDATANGYVRGEGCGVIVLKRVSDALRDRDNILAVIAGSAVNQDGRSSGLTVPNGAAQQALVRDALSHARKEPAHVSYVEAHGTGTSLGDPIEANALGAVLGVGRPKDQPLLIGSVKTNVGHLEAASGIVGLIKVILSLQHKEIPPSLHFKTLNPNISMADSPLQVVTECIPWASEKGARTAGVSSYGLSGTNAHIILEEAPTPENSQSPNEPNLQLLTLSAKSEGALRELAERYKKHLASTQPQELADLCFTANVGRSKFEHRLALVADTPGQMQRGLELFVSGEENPGIMQGRFKGSLPPRPVFLFTGQGSQYIGMGQKLFETQPVYRRTLERCDELLRPHLEHSLLSVIFPNQSDSSLLDETMYTQPALFAVECSLVELWRSWGIEPIAVLGHSVGEYVAAWAAGIFSLEDGIKLIAARGRLMQERCEKGSMAVISANEEQVTRILGAYRDHVSIAALNGPLNTVISGGKDAVEEVQKKFEESQIKTKFLKVSHAFHSMLMDPMLDPFEEIAREIQYSAPQLGFTSNLTGRQLSGGQGIDASYWKSHVREPVRFLDGMRILLQQGHRIFLEIGPSPILLGMAKSCADDRDLVWLPSLRKERDDGQQMLGSLAQLYVRGAEISWTGLDPESKRRRVVLPTYPFERKRFWIESAEEDIEESKNRSPHSQVESIPLLGERLWVAGIKNLIFKRRISSSNPDFLIDHQFYGKVVYPATAYLEMGLTAASEFLGGKQGLVEDFSIREALILSSDETRTLQTVVNEEGGFEIFSSPDASPGSWSLHATGRVRSDEGLPESEYNIDNIRQRCQETIDPAGYYAKIRENEVEYGQQFQGIKELWRRDGESFGEICIADTTLINTNPYHIHPGLLDSCFQMLGPALPNFREVEERGEVYMPVGGERFRLKGKVGNRFYCLAQVRTKAEMPNDMFCADLHLFNTDGKVFGEVTGLRLKQIKREALKNQVAAEINDWLYELVWDRADLQEEPLPKRNGHWLIFADRGGLGQELATQLELRGNGSKVVRSGRETQSTGGTLTILNPEDRNSFRQLFEESGQNGVGAYTGIIHLSSLDSEREQDIESSQIFGCASLLHLAQELTAGKISPSPRLWVVTRGAQAVLGNQEVSVRQAPVWGLCRVVALEHPELQCVRIDLDPAGQRDEAITLLQEIESGSSEDQVAFRQEQRHVARLARCREEVLSMESQKNVIDSPVRLEITERGILDNLRLQPLERRLPGRGEVEIRVHATGLNFRDVLNAMGMYAGDPGPLGGECAGTITAVGEGVDTLSVGNEVMALASDSFATHVTVHAQFVLPKPPLLTLAEVATVPITFLTAWYALNELGHLKKGEKVLIHAAAGGVGLAAIQLAQRAGAEIFATAGSPRKRDYLSSLGIQHVMDSRSLDFCDQILHLTRGEGVHLVLNSLTGEFIPKSLTALGRDGRFMEIGKAGIWSPEQMARSRPDVSYSVIYLGELIYSDPKLVRKMFEQLADGLREGALKPLPLTQFDLNAAPSAFRHMAQAKHIGKVVLVQQVKDGLAAGGGDELRRKNRGPQDPLLDPEGTYLITGGLGGLGLTVAQWMKNEGARNLFLVGRNAPKGTALEVLEEMRQDGVRVIASKGDVSREEEVIRLLDEQRRTLPPLRGIIHAAGVLDDGVLQQQSWGRFLRVLAPKALGAWYFHTHTRQLPLDFFVCFSSVSALLGSSGQGNYCAANAFLDALAHYRRTLELPSLSINWGPWAGAGMAASLETRDQRRMRNMGVGFIELEMGIQALERLMRRNIPQVAVYPMNWRKWGKANPQWQQTPFLSHVIEKEAKSSTGKPVRSGLSRHKLQEARDGERQQLMKEYLRNSLATVLQLSDGSLDMNEPITNFGLDSLMTVELRNRIEADLGIVVPMAQFLEGPSISQLSAQILDLLAIGAIDPTTGVVPLGSKRDLITESPEHLLARLPEMKEGEVEQLLNTLLSKQDEKE